MIQTQTRALCAADLRRLAEQYRKGFTPDPLGARLVILRAANLLDGIGGPLCTVDLARNIAIPHGRDSEIKLRPAEAKILHRLARGGVVGAEALQNALWYEGNRPATADSMMRVHISRLRAKITAAGLEIRNTWDEGYELVREQKAIERPEVAA